MRPSWAFAWLIQDPCTLQWIKTCQILRNFVQLCSRWKKGNGLLGATGSIPARIASSAPRSENIFHESYQIASKFLFFLFYIILFSYSIEAAKGRWDTEPPPKRKKKKKKKNKEKEKIACTCKRGPVKYKIGPQWNRRSLTKHQIIRTILSKMYSLCIFGQRDFPTRGYKLLEKFTQIFKIGHR